MGCWYSRLDREEMVARCKARKRYMKELVKARHAFSAAHSMYLRSLRDTGSTLLQFGNGESSLQHRHIPPAPPVPVNLPPRPISPSSWTHTSTTTTTSSSSIRPPPPPPPPVASSAGTWDFWDPFMPIAGRSADEEQWEEETAATSEAAVTTTTTTARAQSVAAPPSVLTATATTSSSELAVVVSTKSKDLVEIMQELDDYFLKAANAGGPLSLLLEVPLCSLNRQASTGKDYYANLKSPGPLLRPLGSRSARWNAFGKFCEDPTRNNSVASDGKATHCSTVERLYAWEKKLYKEVKNAECLKLEHEKKAVILRKLEMRSADYITTEKAKKDVDKLESLMVVAVQAIETTSAEIIRLRESELYPQLLQLVQGLMNMWRSMYEYHQVQTHIVQQLKYLNCIPSTNPTSEIHRQSTLQLELQAQQWHLSFCNLVKVQRDYIQSLTGWLRLSLFQLGSNPLNKTKQDSAIYSFCEEWQLAINNAPEKVASEGLKSFLTMIHAIVVQQAEEQKQKRKSESAFKELEKRASELRSLESKHGPYSLPEDSVEKKSPLKEKRAKVEALREKAEDEKAKYEKSISVTRALTMNNLQMGMPHAFRAMTGFANVCKQAFESVHNQARTTDDLHSVKMMLH